MVAGTATCRLARCQVSAASAAINKDSLSRARRSGVATKRAEQLAGRATGACKAL